MASPDFLNLARLDLVSIRLAVACARGASLTAAAREANLAVAAASRRIRDLEAALGAELFGRSTRGMKPTAAGELLLRHGLDVLQSLEDLRLAMADLRQGVTRHLRLCANTAAINQFLPQMLARYAQQQPQVRVDLEELVSLAVVVALREGRADVGVFVEGPDLQGLKAIHFRDDELVLVLPRGHRLRGRGALAFAEALDEEWISLDSGAAMLQRQQSAAEALGRPLRLRMQVRSFDAVCHLVAAGLGIAVLPRAAVLPAAKSVGVDWRPLSDPWARRRMLVATRSDCRDQSTLDFAAFLSARP